MTKKENQSKRWIPPVIFLLLIIAVAGLSIFYFKAPPAPQIVLNTIELRNEENTIKRADLITKISDLVDQMDSQNVEIEWESLTECLSTECTNADYLNFLQTAAYEGKIDNYELIINLVLTYKYWNGEDVVKFSKSLTEVDKAIELSNVRVLSKSWDKIVECDGTCPARADLYFDMIKEVVELKY